MYKINFQKPIHIHFIGIGGISMSWQRFFLKKASLYQDPMQKNHL